MDPKFIDMTPTWESLVPAFVTMIENGTPESRQLAIEEISRMARIVDQRIAEDKEAV